MGPARGTMGTQTKGLRGEGLIRQPSRKWPVGALRCGPHWGGDMPGGFLAMWAARPQEGGPCLGPGGSSLLST